MYRMKRDIRAWWSCASRFEIPDDVAEYLHTKPYGDDPDEVGHWYIRYNTLYYNDKEGIRQEIEGTEILADYGGCKIPEMVDDVETGDVLYEDK